MKQSAVKTLGVAALGAAFVAVGAGAAQAAPALPDAPALDTVTQALPADQASAPLAGPAQALSVGQDAAGKGLGTAKPVVDELGSKVPGAGLLGGLPLDAVPGQGVNVNGIPLGSR
ncbi:ATP-binding protein [Streptomyces sp. NPDC096538]|uniref:ATP-binding protein n=1 Tax=Streptomyces sp. NPDC096538 TaxID=3155427 RepID=UPI00331A2740